MPKGNYSAVPKGKMKKAKCISALLLCLTCLLVFTAPAFAANGGEAVVSKVNIQLSASPVVMMDPGTIRASTNTTGCSLVSMNWYDVSSQPIIDAFTSSPTTLVLNIAGYGGYVFADNATAYINGEPVSCAVGGGGTYITLVKEYMPAIWAPSIIKHPGDDKVDEDGTVSFVATAEYADKSTWRVLDQNGQLWTMDQLTEKYPNFNYHDTLGRLVMNHVPRELDGAEFCCTFEGAGGKVDTNWATLKVNYEVEETPAPTPSPSPAPTPAPSRSPAPSPKPSPKAETHTHDFSSAWKSDDAAHWHECDCGEQKDSASHTFTWETVEKATRKAPGKETGVCTVCGYEKERELEYKGFSFDEDFSFDELFTDENIIKLIIIAAAALLLLVIVLIIATKIKRKRELERRRKEALRRRKQQRARREYEE